MLRLSTSPTHSHSAGTGSPLARRSFRALLPMQMVSAGTTTLEVRVRGSATHACRWGSGGQSDVPFALILPVDDVAIGRAAVHRSAEMREARARF
eukprot:3829936-Rhodomonas_salina.2